MSKEKQIEEMTTDIGEKQEGGWVFVDNGEYTTDVFNKELAEYLVVNKGYRKQIEGEWKVEEFYNSGLRMHFGTNITCSCCGYTERKGSAFFTPSNFCPNCGAKMKGGAEE